MEVISSALPQVVRGTQHGMTKDQLGPAARRTVGLPIHETRLTEAFIANAGALMRPGPGRSLYLMLEPRVGRGRPDIIVLAASPRGLLSYFRDSIRFSTFTEAQAISDSTNEPLGISTTYARELRATIQAGGWKDSQLQQAKLLVHDSLAIEAKMADWRRAIRQVARFSPMTHRTAILMPDAVAMRVDRKSLNIYGSGLIAASDKQLQWLEDAQNRPLGDAQKLWLLELLHRQVDGGGN